MLRIAPWAVTPIRIPLESFCRRTTPMLGAMLVEEFLRRSCLLVKLRCLFDWLFMAREVAGVLGHFVKLSRNPRHSF